MGAILGGSAALPFDWRHGIKPVNELPPLRARGGREGSTECWWTISTDDHGGQSAPKSFGFPDAV